MLARQDGVAAVEFAVVIGLLFLILGGIFEFGRAFWHYDALAKAARDGARHVSRVTNDKLGDAAAAAKEIVVEEANDANVPIDDGNVDVLCGGGACTNGMAPPTYVTVQIRDYELTIGGVIPFFWPAGGPTSFTASLAPHTTMRYVPCTTCES